MRPTRMTRLHVETMESRLQPSATAALAPAAHAVVGSPATPAPVVQAAAPAAQPLAGWLAGQARLDPTVGKVKQAPGQKIQQDRKS